MNCSPPGSSVYEISQARILEWVATSFSREKGSSWSRDQIHISCISVRFFLYHWATWEAYTFWISSDWISSDCFWTVVLEKTLESSLDCKEIQSVHPKGNQSWIFILRTGAEAETPILWPPGEKNWLIWKDPYAGKDWSWGKKGTAADEMVGWHHWLNGYEFE